MLYWIADKAVSGFEAIAYAIARRRQRRPVLRVETPTNTYRNVMRNVPRPPLKPTLPRANVQAPEIKTYKAKR